MLDNSKTITAVTYNGANWPVGKLEQSKTLTLGASAPATVTPDSGKVLSSVPVVLDTSVIKAENIKKDVTMLGVTGTHEGGGSAPSLQSKSVTYTANGANTITPDEGYDGLSSVDVTVNVASGGGWWNNPIRKVG